MRDARAEATDRIGGRFSVRVLEPSPPAIDAAPYFADDPVAGGEVVPVERDGARSWESLSADPDDPDLRPWCEDRWLVRPQRVGVLPAALAATRRSLHALAEHVIAPARYRSVGKIGLRFTFHGFGTPYFGAGRQVRIEDGVLIDGDRRHQPLTLGGAAAFLDMDLGAPPGVYTATTPLSADALLLVDPGAAKAVGDWFGLSASLLEQLRAEATVEEDPARVQLWPEHFDIAVDIGSPGSRANYGGSPGDEAHPEPYLYVGPWE
ncbi:MAG: hypothetical protein QOG64_929, partial [Acidimicrobiaceae bacterium]|nr:hypothetical protein [Acidimicrobiaceae bacterium]